MQPFEKIDKKQEFDKRFNYGIYGNRKYGAGELYILDINSKEQQYTNDGELVKFIHAVYCSRPNCLQADIFFTYDKDGNEITAKFNKYLENSKGITGVDIKEFEDEISELLLDNDKMAAMEKDGKCNYPFSNWPEE